MKLIVPLRGVVQGRGGILLGSLIPCALFYFLQLYLKRRRSSSSSSSSSSPSSDALHRASSRSSLSTQQVPLSKLAVLVNHDDSPYYLGMARANADLYHRSTNPHGFFQLGVSDNMLCLDLIGDWVRKWGESLMESGADGGGLSINGIATYQPFDGLDELKIAMSDFMHQAMGGSVKFQVSNMVLTSGATPAVEMLAFCLADHGNAFLVPTPYYPGFDRDVRWRPGVDLIPVHCHSADNFGLSMAALEQAYNQAGKRGVKVRGILLCNPSNPVGNMLTPDMLCNLLNFAENRNIHIIADEVFAGSTYGSEKFVSIAEILDSEDIDKSRVHIVYGLSKDLSLAGFRVGVIYSFNESVLNAAKSLSRFTTISAPTQRLVTSMLSDKRFIQEYFETNRNRLRQAHDEFVDGLSKLGIKCAKSSAGMFCWADMSGLIEAYSEKGELELWEKFLSVAKINITPGSACHCRERGWFRICYTNITSEDIPLVIERIRKVVESCKSSR